MARRKAAAAAAALETLRAQHAAQLERVEAADAEACSLSLEALQQSHAAHLTRVETVAAQELEAAAAQHALHLSRVEDAAAEEIAKHSLGVTRELEARAKAVDVMRLQHTQEIERLKEKQLVRLRTVEEDAGRRIALHADVVAERRGVQQAVRVHRTQARIEERRAVARCRGVLRAFAACAARGMRRKEALLRCAATRQRATLSHTMLAIIAYGCTSQLRQTRRMQNAVVVEMLSRRRAKGGVRVHFRAWADEVAARAAHFALLQRVGKRLVLHAYTAKYRAGFDALSSHSLAMKRDATRAAATRRLRMRMMGNAVASGWSGWVASVAETKRQRAVTTRFAARWRYGKQHALFVAWQRAVELGAAQRKALCRVATRRVQEEERTRCTHALTLVRYHAVKTKESEVRILRSRKLLERFVNRSRMMGWRGWVVAVQKKKEKRALLRKIAQRLDTSSGARLKSSFAAWGSVLQTNVAVRRKVMRVMMRSYRRIVQAGWSQLVRNTGRARAEALHAVDADMALSRAEKIVATAVTSFDFLDTRAEGSVGVLYAVDNFADSEWLEWFVSADLGNSGVVSRSDWVESVRRRISPESELSVVRTDRVIATMRASIVAQRESRKRAQNEERKRRIQERHVMKLLRHNIAQGFAQWSAVVAAKLRRTVRTERAVAFANARLLSRVVRAWCSDARAALRRRERVERTVSKLLRRTSSTRKRCGWNALRAHASDRALRSVQIDDEMMQTQQRGRMLRRVVRRAQSSSLLHGWRRLAAATSSSLSRVRMLLLSPPPLPIRQYFI